MAVKIAKSNPFGGKPIIMMPKIYGITPRRESVDGKEYIVYDTKTPSPPGMRGGFWIRGVESVNSTIKQYFENCKRYFTSKRHYATN